MQQAIEEAVKYAVVFLAGQTVGLAWAFITIKVFQKRRKKKEEEKEKREAQNEKRR